MRAGPRGASLISEQEFEEVYTLHYATLAASLGGFRLDPMTLEDVLQDTFFRLWQQSAMPRVPLAWLRVVARRRVLEVLRNGTKWPSTDVLESIENGQLSPEEEVEQKDCVQFYLAKLSLWDQRVLNHWSFTGPAVPGQRQFTATEHRRVERAKRRLRNLAKAG